MTDSNCPTQMFRVGENVFVTQPHPEGDAEKFRLRIDTYRNHNHFEPLETNELKKRVSTKPTPHAQEILRRFVKRFFLKFRFRPGAGFQM